MNEIVFWGVWTLQGFTAVVLSKRIVRQIELVEVKERAWYHGILAGAFQCGLGFCTYKTAVAILYRVAS